MKKGILLFVTILIVTAGCQPASTPISPTPLPPTTSPVPTATAIPFTPTPLSTLTMTIKDSQCTLDGPATVPHVVLTINLVMDEQTPTESGYALITLKEGKTIEDLKAWPSADQPPWVNLIHGVHEYTNGIHTYTYDYGNVTTDQILYLACFRAEPDTGVIAKIGAFGPIYVKD
jgi:hypothetical protein